MTIWQQGIVVLYALISLVIFVKGFYEVKTKRNPFGLTNYLLPMGIFVWGDAVILGPFWIGISIFSLLLQDWYFFLLAVSLFWTVRSLGEVIYWIAEQFASKTRNQPSTLRFYSLFRNDSVWFVYQLMWQCILVISIIASLYFAKMWLQ